MASASSCKLCRAMTSENTRCQAMAAAGKSYCPKHLVEQMLWGDGKESCSSRGDSTKKRRRSDDEPNIAVVKGSDKKEDGREIYSDSGALIAVTTRIKAFGGVGQSSSGKASGGSSIEGAAAGRTISAVSLHAIVL